MQAQQDAAVDRLILRIPRNQLAQAIYTFQVEARELYHAYETHGRANDIDGAIQNGRLALRAAIRNDSIDTGLLIDLGTFLATRFELYQRLIDLDEATALTQQAVSLGSPDTNTQAMCSNNMANNLMRRYQYTNNVPDLEEAITLARDAVRVSASDSPNRALWLANLGAKLELRFDHFRRLKDLDEAIDHSRQAVALAPDSDDNDADKAMYVEHLCSQLGTRFELLKQATDLDDAINFGRQAIYLQPEGSPDRPKMLKTLANQLVIRFSDAGQRSDLDEAITLVRQAIPATLEDSVERPRLLMSLANNLEIRYEHFGELADLQEAIVLAHNAVDSISPNNKSDEVMFLVSLANKLQSRFICTGSIETLDRAITLARRANQSIPDDFEGQNSGRATCLNTLATKLESRYDRLGKIQDLEEAVDLGYKAVQLTEATSTDYPLWLANLASRLEKRSEHLGRYSDLEDAINFSRIATEKVSKDSPDKIHVDLNLANKLELRFIRLSKFEDLREAIDLTRHAASALTENSPEKAKLLAALANKLHLQAQHSQDAAILQEAIDLTQQAMDIAPATNADRANLLSSMANRHKTRFDIVESTADLDKGVDFARRAADLIPDDSPDQSMILNNFAEVLQLRSQHLNKLEDLEEVILILKRSQTSQASSAFRRVTAGSSAMRILINQRRFPEALAMATGGLELMPHVATRALNHADLLNAVHRFSRLGSDACALQLECGNGTTTALSAALEALEAGRGSLIGLVLDNGVDTADLRIKSETLADEYLHLRDELMAQQDRPIGFDRVQRTPISRPVSRLVEQFDQCLQKIRSLDGFKSFLRHPSVEEMMKAAGKNTIVYVNVSDIRSDAIIITSSVVKNLRLRDFEYNRVHNFALHKSRNFAFDDDESAGRKNKALQSFWKFLWTACVEPILREMGIITSFDKDRDLARIFWIGAGPASTLPFHAAGDHFTSSISTKPVTTMDFVISTYVPSIKSLLNVQKGRSKFHLSHRRLLLATMETTTGRLRLPNVNVEAAVIEERLRNRLGITSRRQCDSRTILTELSEHTLFHFAGHGYSDPINALRSCLFFERRNESVRQQILCPLFVKDLLSARAENRQLAYLSACSTADNQIRTLDDEGLSLAGAFFAAGFRHVIASQWQVMDKVSCEFAESFYAELQIHNSGMIHEEAVARASHLAVHVVRSSRKSQPIVWAPFMHLGM